MPRGRRKTSRRKLYASDGSLFTCMMLRVTSLDMILSILPRGADRDLPLLGRFRNAYRPPSLNFLTQFLMQRSVTSSISAACLALCPNFNTVRTENMRCLVLRSFSPPMASSSSSSLFMRRGRRSEDLYTFGPGSYLRIALRIVAIALRVPTVRNLKGRLPSKAGHGQAWAPPALHRITRDKMEIT